MYKTGAVACLISGSDCLVSGSDCLISDFDCLVSGLPPAWRRQGRNLEGRAVLGEVDVQLAAQLAPDLQTTSC